MTIIRLDDLTWSKILEFLHQQQGIYIGQESGYCTLTNDLSKQGDVFMLEIIDQQSHHDFQHLHGFGITQGFSMHSSQGVRRDFGVSAQSNAQPSRNAVIGNSPLRLGSLPAY